MKINQFKVLAIALAVASPFAASASDGTITVTGTVASTTCTINGGTKDIAVLLPKVSTSALSAAAVTAAPMLFSVDLTACSAGVTGVYTYFEPGVNVDTNGRLINKAATGPASNVLVELFNPVTGSMININNGYASQGPQITVASNVGKGTYGARYYATGAAGSGAFSSSLTYSLVYN